ncbi:MAG: FHA domain-containing protein [Armatimonadetes bacterium]|nr:FHA domain-containing protein [Armatimonadota bacterium]
MARVIRYTLAGMLGAVGAWLIMESTPAMPNDIGANTPYFWYFLLGLVSGLLVGGGIGLAEAVGNASPRQAYRAVLSGALVGAGGGVIGISLGNAIFNVALSMAGGVGIYKILSQDVPAAVTEHLPRSKPSVLTFLILLIGRGSGWAIIGGFIGLSLGIASGSTQRMINGAVGGIIGGGIGGAIFEILGWLNLGGGINIPVQVIRLITYAATGFAIGLFIGFIEEVAKKAWLVRLVGTNEGKQYVIDKPVTVLGRSELVDLPVFGDPDVAERHAAIIRQGERFYIEDCGSYSGTRVNDKPVTKEIIRDRDLIMIGKTRFLFREKATAREDYSPQGAYVPGTRIPTSKYVCPFCGSVKDASGNCQCTLASAHLSPAKEEESPTTLPSAQMTVPVTAQVVSGDVAAQVSGYVPRLVAIAGPYMGKTFPLKPGETRIGRESTKDIALSMDNTVSRNHARIVQEAGGYVIYDDGSTNGTFVNNTRVTRHELANADIVQVGSNKLRFEV